MSKKLKLFVWEDSFCDYTCGLGFAIAKDAEEARDILAEKLNYRHPDFANKPDVYSLKKAIGFIASGGGQVNSLKMGIFFIHLGEDNATLYKMWHK